MSVIIVVYWLGIPSSQHAFDAILIVRTIWASVIPDIFQFELALCLPFLHLEVRRWISLLSQECSIFMLYSFLYRTIRKKYDTGSE